METFDTVAYERIVVLGTGGTIAGLAQRPNRPDDYRAAQLSVAQLVGTLQTEDLLPSESEQVAQIDSKDMDHATLRALALRVAHHLARPAVRGIVITHGTDTIEESAYFLQQILVPTKPVVLTCAMRPANAADADGPGNLADALRVAWSSAAVVAVVCAGTVHAAYAVRKVHATRLDAFSSEPALPLGHVAHGEVSWRLNVPFALTPPTLNAIKFIAKQPVSAWPRVEIVTSHAGASGAVVDALLTQATGAPPSDDNPAGGIAPTRLPIPATASPLRGLVVVATGNGTVHRCLEAALRRASDRGVRVLRALRCEADAESGTPAQPATDVVTSVTDIGNHRQHVGDTTTLPPAKARIGLMLRLMAEAHDSSKE